MFGLVIQITVRCSQIRLPLFCLFFFLLSTVVYQRSISFIKLSNEASLKRNLFIYYTYITYEKGFKKIKKMKKGKNNCMFVILLLIIKQLNCDYGKYCLRITTEKKNPKNYCYYYALSLIVGQSFFWRQSYCSKVPTELDIIFDTKKRYHFSLFFDSLHLFHLLSISFCSPDTPCFHLFHSSPYHLISFFSASSASPLFYHFGS